MIIVAIAGLLLIFTQLEARWAPASTRRARTSRGGRDVEIRHQVCDRHVIPVGLQRERHEMASSPSLRVLCVCACLATAFAAAVMAQRIGTLREYELEGPGHHNDAVGGPLTGPRVMGEPFSADATTILRKTTLVGRKPVNLTGVAHYYRDSAGRVRVEQPLPPDISKPGEAPLVWVSIDNPGVVRLAVVIDPRTRAAAVHGRDFVADCIGGGHTFAVPVGYARFLVLVRPLDYYDVRTLKGLETKEESLGERSIEGLNTVGHRTTIVLPAGVEGATTSVELIDERWESPELKLLVHSRVSDSRTGTIEYRLTNVQRQEPPANLFAIDKETLNSRRVPMTQEPWGNSPWR